MKRIVIDVAYGCQLVIPVELAGFIPSMFIVEPEGYGEDKVFYRTKRPLEFYMTDAEIHDPKPVVPPPPHPPDEQLGTVMKAGLTDDAGIKERPANATSAYKIEDDDIPF